MSEKIRTLIVDDEPLARRNLRVLLEKDPQIEIVDECRNGREAVKAINTLSPDLIFLDIQMPEMDGFDVLAHVGPDHLCNGVRSVCAQGIRRSCTRLLAKAFRRRAVRARIAAGEGADGSARDQPFE
jgi:CheY-like chemotaxis protein